MDAQFANSRIKNDEKGARELKGGEIAGCAKNRGAKDIGAKI